MTSYTDKNGCNGTPEGNERLVDDMGYGPAERALLDLMRLYFLTFADPHSHAWMRTGTIASAHFGHAQGPRIAQALLNVVNAVRLIRSSPFEFSNPECPGCSRILCETERQFMGALSGVLSGHMSAAHANAMLLCEGDDSRSFLAALEDLKVLIHAPNETWPFELELRDHTAIY